MNSEITLKIFTNYQESKNDVLTFLGIFFLVATFISMMLLLIDNLYDYGVLFPIFFLSASLLVSIVQYFRRPNFKIDYTYEMTFSPHAIYIDNEKYLIGDISDFNIEMNMYKNKNKESFISHFILGYTHIMFQPNRVNGIDGNKISFILNGEKFEYLFQIDSKSHWNQFDKLIINLAQSNLISDAKATDLLKKYFQYKYSDIQSFKANLKPKSTT